MTLIKDLIDIPDRVQKGDFVLRLSEDIQHPERVLRELRGHARAGQELRRGADVHPQRGPGPDQQGDLPARQLRQRQEPLHGRAAPDPARHTRRPGRSRNWPAVIQKHNDWLAGKKFLLVPYHMINAHDMESGVLGGYVDFIRRKHPDAPIPPVYMSAAIITQAEAERASYGRRGVLQAAQRRPGRQAARAAGASWRRPGTRRRSRRPRRRRRTRRPHLRLVSTLLKTVATSHAEVISHRGGNFVRFDKGLSIISQHAAGLGYDALILFLDELILWLAMNSADLGFVNREAAKLTNLVEAQTVDRPDADRQLRGPAAGPARADRRARARGRAAELRRRAGLPGGAVRHDHPGGPEPAGDRREAGPAVQERGGPAGTRRGLRADGADEGQRDEHPADPRGRPGDVPPGLPLQPGPGADADRRVQRAPAGADGAEGDDAAPGRPPRDAQGGRRGAGGRPVRRGGPRRRGVQPGHGDPLRERQAALPPEAAAGAGEEARPPRGDRDAGLRRPAAGGLPQRRPAGEDAAPVGAGARGRVAAGPERREAGGA